MNRNSIQQLEAKREGDELKQKIEVNKRLEDEKKQQEHQKNHMHQSDLMGQMRYNATQRQLQTDRDEKEWQSQMDAEKEYRIKLEEALNKPDVHKIHPTRNAIITRNSAGMGGGRGPRSGGFVH